MEVSYSHPGNRIEERHVKNRSPVPVFATLLVLLPLSSLADEVSTVRLASGEKGGTYSEVYAPRVVAALPGREVFVRNTNGSTENLDLVAEGKVDLAFAQADVYAQRLEEEPQLFGKLQIVGTLAQECLYVARPAKGGVQSFRELGAARQDDEFPTISLGATGGGTSDSWNYIVTLIPELAQAEVDHTPGTAALDKLVAGEVDAAAWITDPENFDHKMLVAVRGHDTLALMDVDDAALLDELPGGRKVYRVKKVRTSEGASAPTITTVCTTAMIFAGPGADRGLVKEITQASSSLKAKRP